MGSGRGSVAILCETSDAGTLVDPGRDSCQEVQEGFDIGQRHVRLRYWFLLVSTLESQSLDLVGIMSRCCCK